jgi:hypothetical protein
LIKRDCILNIMAFGDLVFHKFLPYGFFREAACRVKPMVALGATFPLQSSVGAHRNHVRLMTGFLNHPLCSAKCLSRENVIPPGRPIEAYSLRLQRITPLSKSIS